VRLEIEDARKADALTGQEETEGISNYFIGNDPSKWGTDIPNYRKIRVSGGYPGIDLMYYGDGRKLEFDFVVSLGAHSLTTDAQGNLMIVTRLGTLIQHKPKVYREFGGKRQEIDAAYKVRGTKVEFALANWDHKQELVIDPVLVYSTFPGGSLQDTPSDLAVDSSGAAYITGYTLSAPFPISLAWN